MPPHKDGLPQAGSLAVTVVTPVAVSNWQIAFSSAKAQEAPSNQHLAISSAKADLCSWAKDQELKAETV
jgi:hypothetical protein